MGRDRSKNKTKKKQHKGKLIIERFGRNRHSNSNRITQVGRDLSLKHTIHAPESISQDSKDIHSGYSPILSQNLGNQIV